MKRLHVNVNVENLEDSVRFYSTLFAAEPTLLKPDYAKWMLDDPLVNFSINAAASGGIAHLGIQAETEDELSDVYNRLQEAGGPTLDEGETTCCYAHSNKQWIEDPQGVAWETFLTHGESESFGYATGEKPTEVNPVSGCGCC